MSGRAAPSGQRDTEGQRRRSGWDREKKETEEKKTRLNAALSFLPTSFLQVWETLCFPSAADKSNSFSWNWQMFVSGQLTIFSLPVMKVVAGVNALGGNGGLFIPSATRVLLGLWSVIVAFPERRRNNPHCALRGLPLPTKGCEGKIKERHPHTHLTFYLSLHFYLHLSLMIFLTVSSSYTPTNILMSFFPSLTQDVWLFWLRVELAVFSS